MKVMKVLDKHVPTTLVLILHVRNLLHFAFKDVQKEILASGKNVD